MNSGAQRQTDPNKRLSVTFKDPKTNEVSSKDSEADTVIKPTKVAFERQAQTKKTQKKLATNITLNRDRKFSFTYNTRIEGGNGEYDDYDEGQYQSLQSLTDKSGS